MSLARLCEIVTDIIQRHMHRQAHTIANAEMQNGRHRITDTGHCARLPISRRSEDSRTVQPSPRGPETRTQAHNTCRRHAAHAGTQTGTQGHIAIAIAAAMLLLQQPLRLRAIFRIRTGPPPLGVPPGPDDRSRVGRGLQSAASSRRTRKMAER